MLRKIVLVLVTATTLALAGCAGGNAPAPSPTVTVTAAPIVPEKGYVVLHEYAGEIWTYGCDEAKGYIPVDVGIGDLIQRDGSSYKLTQHKDSWGEQTSVTLTIKLADNQTVPVIIVDNEYHSENEASGQALYQPQLQGKSSLKVTLPTAGFGGGIPTAITKATACTKYTPTPAQTG